MGGLQWLQWRATKIFKVGALALWEGAEGAKLLQPVEGMALRSA